MIFDLGVELVICIVVSSVIVAVVVGFLVISAADFEPSDCVVVVPDVRDVEGEVSKTETVAFIDKEKIVVWLKH